MISTPIRFQTFAGRALELEHLLDRRVAAAKGRGGIVLIAGDPGIGKSRLVREFLALLPPRTTKIARGAYGEFAQRPLEPLLDVLAQLGHDVRSRVAPRESRASFTAALVDAFESAAATRTIVVVLEDLHWADLEALHVLVALADRIAARRMLFVATYRDAEITSAHPNFSMLGRLLRRDTVSLVTLEALIARDLSELLRAALVGRTALPASVLDGIRRRCDGNAFFAEELLRYAVDRHTAGKPVTVASMPLSIHAAVRDRVALCSPDARSLLSQASLFGRSFESVVLRAIFPPAGGAEAFASNLAELVRLGLLDRVAGDGADFRFRHALSRETVYEEIPTPEARALHARIAEAIAGRGDAQRFAESLAHHYWQAHLRERAAPHCIAAADAARALYAYAEACDWYERASQCFVATADAGRALQSAAQVAVYADQIDRALALYERARASFARAGSADDVVIASVLEAATRYEQGSALEAAALLEEARDRWSERATPLVRDRLLLRLGFLYAFTRRVDDAWACLQAIPEPGRHAPAALAAERSFLASSLHAQRAEVDAWRASFERALALFERPGAIADNRRIALSNAAQQALALGELDAARDYQIRALDVARAIRSHAAHERVLLAQIEVHAGDVAAARAGSEESPPQDRFASRVEHAILAAWVAQLCGDEAAATVTGMPLIADASAGGDLAAHARLACAFAPLLDRLGRTREADALFARASATIDTPFGMTFAIAALGLGRPALVAPARALVAKAALRPGDRVNRALLALIDASVARMNSIATFGASALSAAEGFESIGWHWLAAQAMEIGGRRGEALRFYRRVDAVAELRRLERTAIGRPLAENSASVLTPRERELALIVAGGAGNRAAASRLSISEKAVEKYLTSIYAKLGIASRTQLAAYLMAIPTAVQADEAGARVSPSNRIP